MTRYEYQDYIFTLEICEKELPSDAHPTHYERLRKIRSILKTLLSEEDKRWITKHQDRT